MTAEEAFRLAYKTCYDEAKVQMAAVKPDAKITDQHQAIGATWALLSAAMIFMDLAKQAQSMAEGPKEN